MSRFASWLHSAIERSAKHWPIYKALVGLLLLVFCSIVTAYLWLGIISSRWNSLVFTVVTVLTLIMVFVGSEAIGMMSAKPTEPQIYQPTDKPAIITFVPGYNGSASSLHGMLKPWFGRRRSVDGIEYPPGRFTTESVVEKLAWLFRQNHKKVVYSQSTGGVFVAQTLLDNPELHLTDWILDAVPDGPQSVKAPLWVGLLHGGPLLTWLMKLYQMCTIDWAAAHKDIWPEAHAAYSRSVTGISAMCQLSQIAALRRFEPIQPGSLAGRVDRVTIIKSAGDEDALVRTKLATEAWVRAFESPDGNSLTEVTIITLEDAPPGSHCATAEFPHGVAKVILSRLEVR